MDLVCLEGTGSKVSNLTGHRFVDWMPGQLKLCYSDIQKCFKKNWAYSRDTRSGVFKPVQFADWAASIVPMLKSEKKSCSENFWWFCEPGVQRWQLPASYQSQKTCLLNWLLRCPRANWIKETWDCSRWVPFNVKDWQLRLPLKETPDCTVNERQTGSWDHWRNLEMPGLCVNPMQSVLC